MVCILNIQNSGGFTTQNDTVVSNGTPLISFTQSPIVFGCWFWASNINGGSIWTLSNSVNVENIHCNLSGGNVQFGGSETTDPLTFNAIGGVAIAGTWTFVLCRQIGATHLIDTITADGKITHGSDVEAMTWLGPADTFTIGSAVGGASQTNRLDVCEFWYADGDVQASAGQTSDATLWSLAFQGPFANPQLVPNIIEYRAWRADVFTPSRWQGEYYYRSTKGEAFWQNGSGTGSAPTTGYAPPLPSTYVRPRQAKTLIIV